MKKFIIVIGVLALLVGGLVLAGGFVMKGKAGNLASAPQVKTGDALAKGAAIGNAAGLVTLTGAVKCDTPLMSPVAGKPCLFYTHEVKSTWDETSLDTATGKMKTTSKSETVSSDSDQAAFTIDDGSGAIPVKIKDGSGLDLVSSDPSSVDAADAPTVKRFGKLKFRANSKIVETERLLVAAPTFTVHGKLAAGAIGPDDLMISLKSRDEMLAATSTMASALLTIGWVGTIFGVVVILLGMMIKSKSKVLAVPAPR